MKYLLYLDGEFEIESNAGNEEELVTEFMEELSYIGEALTLDYDVKRVGENDDG